MIRLILNITGVLTCFTLIIIGLLQIDDKQVPELTQLMEQLKSPNDSKAYLYLMGMDAPNGVDPLSAGAIALQQNNIKRKNDGNRTLIAEPQTTKNVLAMPDNDLLCSYSEDSCLSYIFNNLNLIEDLINKHKILIDRYRIYANYHDFHTLSEPYIAEKTPPYFALSKAVQLTNLSLFLKASKGDVDEAINLIYQLQSQLRQQLSQQDVLIGKLIYLKLISDNLDLLSVISNQYNYKLPNKIKLLSLQERSLRSSFVREIHIMSHLYEELDGAPDIFSTVGEEVLSHVPSWVTHMLFKKNMTFNESYKVYVYYTLLSETSIEIIEKEITDKALMPLVIDHWIRNPIGTILNQIGQPDYLGYIASFGDIDNKIKLFNTGVNNMDNKDIMNGVRSVYNSTEHNLPYFNEDKTILCFDSLFENSRFYNCLRIRIH